MPMRLPDGTKIRVTARVGLACWTCTGEGAEDIRERADRALNRAKAAGRDTFEQMVF
jgi:PleD family two-component response regulator